MASLIHATTGPKLSPWTKLSVVNPRLGCSSLRRCRNFVTQAKVREIFMPALSSTMTEGKIVSWTKSEGDKVKKGESVVVVESDKADMDVETFYDGYLAAIVVEEGNVAPVGSAIALLAETEQEIAEAKAKAMSNGSATTASSAPPIPSAEPVATAAAVSESKSQSVSVSTATAPKIESSSSAPAAIADAHPASEGGKRVIATPYAKKLAKEYKLDLAQVAGSGPNGRIVAKDIEAIAGSGASTLPVPAQQPSVSAAPVTIAPKEQAAVSIVPGTSVPFTAMQSAVCRNMVESLQVPVFRVGYSMVTDKLDALYKKIKSKDVTMTALLAKATALALAKHPALNACCKDGKSFTYNGNINIAVAVAMDGGLITPVLQDANKVDIYTLSRKWKELVGKARAKQLQPQEFNTGTFTLSNLGMFGVDRFDAILPPGTGAIMAVGSSQPTVVATPDGLIGVKSQMQINVTADHRIIYGADVAAFLQTLAQIIEQPDELTL